jgi:hypothetical protein
MHGDHGRPAASMGPKHLLLRAMLISTLALVLGIFTTCRRVMIYGTRGRVYHPERLGWRARPRVGGAQQEGDERAAHRSLGAKRTPAWRLSTACTTSVQRRASSAFAWSTRPPPSTNTYGQFRAASMRSILPLVARATAAVTAFVWILSLLW